MLDTTRRLLLAAALTVLGATAASAQADFSGETVNVYIRSSAGGGYDDYGRLIARHIGKYLPGNPDVVAINKPGAGGIVAANYMARQARRDGTEIAILDRGIAFAQRLEKPGIAYDVSELSPIGSAQSEAYAFVVSADTPVDNVDEFFAHDGTLRFATTGPGSDSWRYGELLAGWGAPIEQIGGYEGTSEKILAVARGEVQGTSGSYGSLIDAAEAEGFKFIGSFGTVRQLPDLQKFSTIVPEGDRALYAVATASLEAGRPFFAPPGVTEERLAALREAFRKALEDPELQAEAEKAGRDVAYLSPEEMTALYADILGASDEVIAKFGED